MTNADLSDGMPVDRMWRMVTAKQQELEHVMLNNAVLSVHALAGDLALLYGLFAEHLRQELGKEAS